MHSDPKGPRLATRKWAKSGPPLWGCLRKPLGRTGETVPRTVSALSGGQGDLPRRRLAGPGNQPALRKAPCREAS
jgi:hypothetical protein